MGSKTSTLASLVAQQRDKGQKARARKVQRRHQRSPVKWLEREWKALMSRHFPESSIEWTGAESSLVKKLVDERGFDEVLKLFNHFFETWGGRKVSRSGTPGVKLLWVMRGQLDAELAGRLKAPELRETRMNSGEFSEEAASVSPSHGWGDFEESADESYEGGGHGW